MDDKVITSILAYHVTDSNLPSKNITSGFVVTGNGNAISIVKVVSSGSVTINSNAQVVSPDITGTNGVVHIIDSVLMPPPLDVTGIVANTDNLSVLLELLSAANLDDALQADGPFTVFAPTDSAFEKLGQATLDGLKNDEVALANILLYHVTTGYVGSAQLVGGPVVTTLAENGATIRVRENGLILNDVAALEKTDIIATNGVVHLIDTVLIPPMPMDP